MPKLLLSSDTSRTWCSLLVATRALMLRAVGKPWEKYQTQLHQFIIE